MPIFRGIFKTPAHRKYNYNPRYFDAESEELQERLQNAEKLKAEGAEGSKARILFGLRRGGYSAESESMRKKSAMRSNMLLLGIIVVLIVISVFLIEAYLPLLLQEMEGK